MEDEERERISSSQSELYNKALLSVGLGRPTLCSFTKAISIEEEKPNKLVEREKICKGWVFLFHILQVCF